MNKTFVIVLTLVLAGTGVHAGGGKGKGTVTAVRAATTNPALPRIVTRSGPVVDGKITARRVLVPPRPVTAATKLPFSRVPRLDLKKMGPAQEVSHFPAVRTEISGVPAVIAPQVSAAVEAAVERASVPVTPMVLKQLRTMAKQGNTDALKQEFEHGARLTDVEQAEDLFYDALPHSETLSYLLDLQDPFIQEFAKNEMELRFLFERSARKGFLASFYILRN